MTLDAAAAEEPTGPVAREHHLTVSRSARYMVLGEPGPGTRALWVALHGYGQLAARFARHCRPLAAPDRLVVVPEALSRFYVEAASGGTHAQARVGATWMTREDRLAEISDYVAYLDRVVARVAEELPALPPVNVLGFSQGAATAGRWALFGAVPLASLTVWGGALPDDLDLAALRERLAGAPVTIVVGSEDHFRPAERAREHLATLTGAGIDARVVTYAGGHHLEPGVLRALADG